MVSSAPVALVTGGARRIGRAIVEDLAAHGWAVAIHHHQSHAEAEQMVGAIAASGGRATMVMGDLADPDCHTEMIAEAAKVLGPVTLLVNNASIFEKDTIGALARQQWDRQFAVNLAAPVFLAEAFAKALAEGAEGNVINLLDQRIWHPGPAYFSYQLTKSALAVATETLAMALAPRIRVNGIAPGPVLPSAHASPEAFARQIASLPLQRQPELADFGRTVRYLVENRSITGQIIALDGGQHLGFRPAESTSSSSNA
ncbi:MAG TPA: SDR family oxidoreductase [Bauldia sp.]|nr:SDR family oxidoreductase [Bauldia sp.]